MKRFNWLNIIIIIGLFLGGCLWIAVSQTPKMKKNAQNRCHVMLFDVSGSMKERYRSPIKDWLIKNLLQSPNVFSPDDYVVVREFNNQGNQVYSKIDKQRKYAGKLNIPEILNQVPVEVTKYDTNIQLAIKQAINDIKGIPLNGEVLIWMLTDNVQDDGGKKDIDSFYKTVNSETNIRAAYVYPLVSENGKEVLGDAMVLYLFKYAQNTSSNEDFEGVAKVVEEKIGNSAVTWFPRGITFSPSNIIINGESTVLVEDKLILPSLPEGESPDYNITFQVSSKLRGIEIVTLKIRKAIIKSIQVPAEGVQASGDLATWSVDPPVTIAGLRPGQTSSGSYTTTIRAPDLAFHASNFWVGLVTDESEPVTAILEYEPDSKNVQTRLTTKLDNKLKQARNLQSINDFAGGGDIQKKPITVSLAFRIRYNNLWRRVIVAGLTLVLLAAGFFAFSLMAGSRHYELCESGALSGRHLSLPLFGSMPILSRGEMIARINSRFGRVSVTGVAGYVIIWHATHSAFASKSFVVKRLQDNAQISYELRLVVKGKNRIVHNRDDDLYG